MLFKISQEDVFDDNPHLSILPQFKGITSDEFKFVALYADWKSPYKNLGPEERYQRAMGAVESIRKEKIDKYVQAYYEMQGIGSERESLEALEAALSEIRKRLKNAADLEADEIKKLSASLIDLTKQRKAIELLINNEMNMEQPQDSEVGGMSAIDEFHA
jgi:hypothetical protein